MSKDFWFPFHVNDFLSSSRIALMTTEEIGAYTLLLCHAWNDPSCSLPNDVESLRKLGRISGDLTRIIDCFYIKDDRFINERLYKEWKITKQKRKVGHEKSVHANEIRWGSSKDSSKDSARTPPASTSTVTSTVTSTDTDIATDTSDNTVGKVPAKRLPLPKEAAKGAATWEGYRSAYQMRYGVDPVRNGSVNALLAKVVDKLGMDDAPLVAAYYVTHESQWYVTKMHPVNLLVVDAEKLRTEWATQTQVTATQARQGDGKAARGQMWNELIAEFVHKEAS